MRYDVILRLCRLHIYRNVKSMWKAALVMGGVLVLPLVLTGEFKQELTVGLLGGFLMLLPAHLALNMTEEKIDGSLRMLASLPITGREHAASRLVAAAALTMPLVIHLATLLPLFDLLAFPRAVGVGIGMGVTALLVGLVGVALQYRFSGQKVRSMFSMAVFVVVGLIWLSTLFEGWPAWILSPVGVVTLSLIPLIATIAGGWYAIRTIVKLAPVYERDQDAMTTGVAE